jgi:8-oxo-dGTP pyrophosphatase MutT (NUDIX family)
VAREDRPIGDRPLDRLARAAARRPRIHGLLRTAARRRAGRHWVAAVGAVIDGDRVLVAEHAFRGGSVALLGGWIHVHEDPFRAVEREVREETGLEVEALDVVACERQGAELHPLRYSALTIGFRCRLGEGALAEPAVVSPELREVRWVAVDAAGELLTAFEAEVVAQAWGRVSR